MENKNLLSKEEQKQINQVTIELEDERNISIANSAKAKAYDLIMYSYSITITILVLFNLISVPIFFILLSVFIVCQGYFIFCLRKYHKEN